LKVNFVDKNVRWKVVILNDKLRKLQIINYKSGDYTGGQEILPYNPLDVTKYKVMLKLYDESKEKYSESSVWLIGITKSGKQTVIFRREILSLMGSKQEFASKWEKPDWSIFGK